MDLTEAQARKEFAKLTDEQIIALAESEGKPTGGMSRNDLIELLLGHCVGCKKGSITVIIISGRNKKIVQTKTSAPCVGCGK